MKKLSILFLLLLLVTFNASVSAQSTTDTVYIPGSSSLKISEIVNADTSVHAHRVYVLDRGAIYYIESAFEITHSCKFIAKGNAARPPVLAPAIRSDNSSEEWFFKFMQSGIEVELNDLYLLSMRSDEKSLGWSRAIHSGADSVKIKLRNIVFDGFSEAAMRSEGKGTKLDVQDCHFRNLMHSSSYFAGQGYLSASNQFPDSTIFINNTFFCTSSYLFDARAVDKYSVFEHNTVVYNVITPFLLHRARNLHFNNNLLIATHAYGGDPYDVFQGGVSSYPDTTAAGAVRIWMNGVYFGDTLSGPEFYDNEDLGIIYDPSKRVVEIKNNVYHLPDGLVNFYNTWNDTVTVVDTVETTSGSKQALKRILTLPKFMNPETQRTLDSLSTPGFREYSPYVNVENNMDVDPGFTDQEVIGHVDELVEYVKDIAEWSVNYSWQYKFNFPPAWPLPENLAYSNASLQSAGTDGFAVGDLNWFPAQKQQWMTDVKSDVSVIPSEFTLEQNYPNPFNPSTTIKFSVPKAGNYSLRVFNVLGQEVAKLHNGQLNAGTHEATFNASKLGSGVYFYNLTGNEVNITKKMMLIK